MPLKSEKSPPASVKKLGVIAGEGTLPGAIASEARRMGYWVTAIALQPAADDSIREHADEFHKIPIGRFGSIIKTLKKASVKEAVMAGKVSKDILYQDMKSILPDLRATRFLLSLKNRADITVLDAISDELRKDGIALLKTVTFTKNLLTPSGLLTRNRPDRKQMEDVEYGWKIAKEMGRLDIGQTVVVKEKAVLSVEAMEGTDEAILRGGTLAREGAVVVKVSKPQQDMRLDVPVVGTGTLMAMKKAHAVVLALEAGKSIILDREKCIREADKAGIVMMGIGND